MAIASAMPATLIPLMELVKPSPPRESGRDPPAPFVGLDATNLIDLCRDCAFWNGALASRPTTLRRAASISPARNSFAIEIDHLIRRAFARADGAFHQPVHLGRALGAGPMDAPRRLAQRLAEAGENARRERREHAAERPRLRRPIGLEMRARLQGLSSVPRRQRGEPDFAALLGIEPCRTHRRRPEHVATEDAGCP